MWHCHLLEHEDNEMMRPYIVVSPQDLTFEIVAIVVVALVVVIAIVAVLTRRRGKR